MTGTRPADILRHLDPPGADDRTLVNRYASHGDQAAFAELVRRHGPLVWAACLRVVGNRHDAEDAFQAVFLVFMRKLAAVRNPDLLGNWLYGVAVRVSMKARRSALRRNARERQVPTMPDPPSPAVESPSDLGPVIDEELAALPAWYRDAVVLCDLRGVSREEAAKVLGIPEGTLSSRLAAGRKKLAARLTRRGVTLSVAAIPGLLGAGARAAVPAELVARVIHISTGAAVPVAVARLASEGFSVKKLLMGVMFAAAAAGMVYAAGPTDPPQKADPPKPPPVVAKAESAPEAKPDEKVSFTTRPRLVNTTDLRGRHTHDMYWSPDGRSLLLWVSPPLNAMQSQYLALIIPDAVDAGAEGQRSYELPLSASTGFVRYAPDSKTIITDRREHGLLSGRHELRFWEVVRGRGALPLRTVSLEAAEGYGYAFAPDGKTFRTVATEKNSADEIKAVEVREVETATGKVVKSLLKKDVPGPWQLSPEGKRLAVLEDGTKLTVYDVDASTSLFTKHLSEKQPEGAEPRERRFARVVFSPDGKLLVVSRGVGLTDVLNADTGDSVKTLEGIRMLSTHPESQAVGADGRLLAMTVTRYAPAKSKGPNGVERTVLDSKSSGLTVWDLTTGKALKSWDRAAVVAVNPNRPLVATAESNGDEIRLGLWDFAAEVGKK